MRALLLFLLCCGCSRLPPVVSVDSGLCDPTRAKPIGSAGFLPYGHAHNDYEHPRPLLDALDAKFYSVEADIFMSGGVIVVAHDTMMAPKGALKDLYLDPLQARVTANGGSVYGDGVPFILWLDLKDSTAELRTALEALLSQYPMLSVFTDDAVTQGPVTAVLTGSDSSKKAYVNKQATRHAIRDDGAYSPSDPPADNRWSWYALDYSQYMSWNGATATIPEAERVRLQCLVGDIHAKGRKLRFWNDPETTEFWRAAIAAGVDLIGTDNLTRLNGFLSTVPP